MCWKMDERCLGVWKKHIPGLHLIAFLAIWQAGDIVFSLILIYFKSILSSTSQKSKVAK